LLGAIAAVRNGSPCRSCDCRFRPAKMRLSKPSAEGSGLGECSTFCGPTSTSPQPTFAEATVFVSRPGMRGCPTPAGGGCRRLPSWPCRLREACGPAARSARSVVGPGNLFRSAGASSLLARWRPCSLGALCAPIHRGVPNRPRNFMLMKPDRLRFLLLENTPREFRTQEVVERFP